MARRKRRASNNRPRRRTKRRPHKASVNISDGRAASGIESQRDELANHLSNAIGGLQVYAEVLHGCRGHLLSMAGSIERIFLASHDINAWRNDRAFAQFNANLQLANGAIGALIGATDNLVASEKEFWALTEERLGATHWIVAASHRFIDELNKFGASLSEMRDSALSAATVIAKFLSGLLGKSELLASLENFQRDVFLVSSHISKLQYQATSQLDSLRESIESL